MQITDWQFRFAESQDWRPIAVPGCWEDAGFPKDRPGPGWYRARPVVPPAFAGRRVFLRFGAASYGCDVYVAGRLRGRHTGAWDAFEVEVTQDALPGRPLDLLLRVEKPASLSDGPASPPVPGAYPLRSTLAGFLPYVWGHMFGGLWQPVELVAAGPARLTEAYARGTPDGRVALAVAADAPARVTVELRGPGGELLLADEADIAPTGAVLSYHLSEPVRPWSPAAPALYTAIVRTDGDERVLRFGLRELRADGAALLLNGRPLYPRMILSWGWYPGHLSPNPGPARVREDFAKLKALGYNGVKLCLWFPPQYYFDLADELGILLWVELPMWSPDPDAHFRRQLRAEYERLVKLARQHPAVILYSLGCELNRTIGPDILGPLYGLVRRLGGDALVRDNSGSGEAYGGLLNEFADYYDYHFYSDLQFFRPLLDSFSPRWRPPQPWIFGEFCDYDTFRPFEGRAREGEALPATHPWWRSRDPAVNPQGARWQMDAPHHEDRLRASGLWARAAALERLSELHGLLHRKWTVELVRTYREIGGYVITGEADTPISTAGMWDDAGRLKFDPAAFRAFNGDTVLALGWDKRRAWVHGGDRAAPWDTFSYESGAVVRPHVVAAHHGAAAGPAEVAWSAALEGEPPFAQGQARTPFPLAPGDVRELLVAELRAPDVDAPRRAVLRASVTVAGETTANEWPLWFFPTGAWDGLVGVALHDPASRLEGLRRLAPHLSPPPSWGRGQGWERTVVIATAWSLALDAFVAAGGRALLLQDPSGPPGPVPTLAMPFWREALRVCEPHPAWGDFPHAGWAELQFYGCAADHALDTAQLGARARPILRRVDTRTMHYHDYAAEIGWGAGTLIVSTLRFGGGLGDQPLGIARNTAAAYLLSRWVRWLAML